MAKLENKTKAQLIEIIMRKDDVENELRKELTALKADYEAMCDDTVTKNAQKMEDYEDLLGDYNTLKKNYENLIGDYNTFKKSYEHAIKDCRGTAKRLEDVSANLANVQEELAETKKQRDAWLATTVVSVIIACVVICVL